MHLLDFLPCRACATDEVISKRRAQIFCLHALFMFVLNRSSDYAGGQCPPLRAEISSDQNDNRRNWQDKFSTSVRRLACGINVPLKKPVLLARVFFMSRQARFAEGYDTPSTVICRPLSFMADLEASLLPHSVPSEKYTLYKYSSPFLTLSSIN